MSRILKRLDYILLFAVLALTAIGITLIGSATHINLASEDRYWFVQRQSMFAVLNLIFIFFSLRFDYRLLEDMSNRLYIFNLIMLLAVMFLGHSALGAQRWIQIGPVSIQPSEFSKIIMIVALAAFINKRLTIWIPFGAGSLCSGMY